MSKRETYNIWKSYLESRRVQEEVKEQYLSYINSLLEKNVPIIFNFDHLGLLLGRSKYYLASVINSPENHYREFKIKKRSKGFRKITTPYPALLEMQYWIYINILKNIQIHSTAHGFTHKKSIITNSKIHAGQNHLLKIDLKDFFPSIEKNRIIHIFKELGYPNIIAFYLAQICCYEDCLPQGAPTSPILSNIVSTRLDKRLINLSKKFELKYTRYADDLTFSGNSISATFISYVNDIINDEGFEININKTRLYQQKGKRIVTGVSVLEEEIKIPRDYKRRLKQELHYIFKFGLKSHMAKNKIRKANYLYVILGKVNFWLSIEPNNEYAVNARNRLKELI
ncbi:retron St85 family RNA-directed DNA polymerase [Flagellimonas beolgyonensis]|uniref:retron St85 family RNA-directed DNA polymerase n=1 Tax=Flagellimonas beolgyonensis TaxID=864064 RepID=UPI003D661CD4